MESTLKRKPIDDTTVATTETNDVKTVEPLPATNTPAPVTKKQKKNNNNNTSTSTVSNTIPILRGKFKERFLTKHSSLIKRSETASGIMITCGINAETRALGQAQRVLEAQLAHYSSFGQIRQQGKDSTNDDDTSINDDKTNTSDSANNKDNNDESTPSEQAPKKHRKFQSVDTACSGLIFYRFRVNIKPTEFMDDMIKRLIASDDKKEKESLSTTIRHCSRWIPLDYICHVTNERISDCFATRVLPECIADLPANTTIAIVTEIRNNLSITKPELINIIAPQLPAHLKVDLKNPQYVIYVTIFKSVCGMAVLKDYYQRKKYNLGALL
ncbi:unnamed protein product [Absidia cylindrospora]